MNKNSKGRVAAFLLAALGASACAPLPTNLPPRPQMAAPRIQAALPAGEAAAGWLPASWWRLFGDAALDTLEARALAGNPSLTVASARTEAARRQARLASLDAGVHYDGNVTVQRERLTANGIFPPPIGGASYTQDDASLGVSYTLDWWGKNRALVAAAAGEAAAAKAEEGAARLTLSALVADAYFTLADAAERAELARQSVAARQEMLDLLKLRLARGLDLADRLRQEEQALGREKEEANRLAYELRAGRYRLAALLGDGPDAAAALPRPRLAAPPALPASLPLDWLAARPDVAAQRRRVDAEAARSDAARADFYPNVNLVLLAGFQSIDAARWFRRDSINGALGPAIHIPLFNTDTLQTRLGVQEAAYGAAVGEYNRTVVEAARQAADGYALTASLAERCALQADVLAAAERSASLARTRNRSGLASRLKLLASELALLAARQADTQLRAARLHATVALAQALGGGRPAEE